MSNFGGNAKDLLVLTRSVLLDALVALQDHQEAIIVIGAQAVYLRTGGIDVALAEATKDSDVAVDPRILAEDPLLEAAMKTAGFFPSANGQPGAWVSSEGIPVDLMVPDSLAGPGSRSASIPPHGSKTTRRARGLEATLNDKDPHDAYRILRAVETEDLRAAFTRLLADGLSEEVTREALVYLADLFAVGPEGIGAMMAGRAEEAVGEPAQVSAAVAILSGDLLDSLGHA